LAGTDPNIVIPGAQELLGPVVHPARFAPGRHARLGEGRLLCSRSHQRLDRSRAPQGKHTPDRVYGGREVSPDPRQLRRQTITRCAQANP